MAVRIKALTKANTEVDLEELMAVHGQGYLSALDAGVKQCNGVFQQLERRQDSRQ